MRAGGIYAKIAADAHKAVRDYSFNMGEFVWTGFDYGAAIKRARHRRARPACP
jgi:hypothetical protein